MADEIGGGGFDNVNTGGEVREDTNKVTEEAVRRVQEDQKRAQQVGQEIRDDKAKNAKVAKFLAFLLRDIKNDQLIKQVYEVFFKSRDEESGLLHLRKNANSTMIVGMFVPFYQEEIKELGLTGIYEEIFSFDGDIYLTEYIGFIKRLLPKFHDNIVLDKKEFVRLLALITEYYHLTEKLSGEKAIEFEETIKKEITLNG